MGIRDGSTVPVGPWYLVHASYCDDGRRSGRQHVGGVLGQHGELERGPWREPCRDGVGVGDGARVDHGSGGCFGARTRRADGMRGDGVGVGDVGAVPGWSRHLGLLITVCCFRSFAIRKPICGLFLRHCGPSQSWWGLERTTYGCSKNAVHRWFSSKSGESFLFVVQIGLEPM